MSPGLESGISRHVVPFKDRNLWCTFWAAFGCSLHLLFSWMWKFSKLDGIMYRHSHEQSRAIQKVYISLFLVPILKLSKDWIRANMKEIVNHGQPHCLRLHFPWLPQSKFMVVFLYFVIFLYFRKFVSLYIKIREACLLQNGWVFRKGGEGSFLM